MAPATLMLALSLAELPQPDVDALALAASRGIEAIEGCHRLRGTVVQAMDLGVFGEDEELYTFVATLDQGRWSTLSWEQLSDANPNSSMSFGEGEDAVPFIPPLFGVLPPELDPDDSDLGSLLETLVAVFDSPVETFTLGLATLEGAEVYRLEREVSDATLGPRQGKRMTLEVLLTGEPHRARRWTATAPKGLPRERGQNFKSLTLRLLAAPDGVPAEESFEARIRAGLVGVTLTQRITYTRAGTCA